MRDFRPIADKQSLLARVGDMSQVAGIRRSFICDGRAREIEALDVVTGGGLEFTVLPGRGMDIAHARYKGAPLCFISKAGLGAADAYEPAGMGWLRNFYAGLLTTCGLSNVGWVCEENDSQLGTVHHGLHGRVANTGADNISYSAAWEDGEFVIRAGGRMREGVLHGENLTLTRAITTGLSHRALRIRDVAENDGFTARPLMLLYHINAGYPLVGEHSELLLPSLSVTGSEAAEGREESYNDFSAPVHEGEQYVYRHELGAEGGRTRVAVVNRELEFGMYVAFDCRQLGKFMQWKRFSQGDYVVGLEPANCEAVGRVEMARRGGLEYLEPGERRVFDLEIGVLDGAGEIDAFRRDTEALRGQSFTKQAIGGRKNEFD
jgi:hypothetical protein